MWKYLDSGSHTFNFFGGAEMRCMGQFKLLEYLALIR